MGTKHGGSMDNDEEDLDEVVGTDSESDDGDHPAESFEDPNPIKSGFQKDLKMIRESDELNGRKLRRVKAEHPADSKELKQLERGIKESQNQFARRGASLTWRRLTKERMNFLHFMASEDLTKEPKDVKLQTTVAYIVTQLCDEMGVLDSSQRTPLTIAIVGRNDVFVRAVCKGTTSAVQARISTALASECVNSRDNENITTCLHAAIQRGSLLRLDLTKVIIELAPEGLFTVADSRGRTPLHLAVEYHRCNNEQIQIVEKLLCKGPAALSLRTSGHPMNRRSVYQHHAKTREDSRQQEAKERSYEESISMPELGQQEMKGHISLQEIKGDMTAVSENGQLGKQGPAPTAVEGSGKPFQTTVEKHIGLALNTHLSHTASLIQSPASTAPKQMIGTTAEKIEESLKLAYFRVKKPHELRDYLHLPTQGQRGKEMWFDFGPEPHSTISFENFKKQFGHLVFDDVLQYVKFPRLTIDDGPPLESDIRYQGNKTLVPFFKWLKSKGVERIVRVDVDDTNPTCHSEAAIEDALDQLQVEVLNWRRLDLCPSTIACVGTHLREVHLQWGGSNAVLRAWSSINGLCMIPTLERIHIEHMKVSKDHVKPFIEPTLLTQICYLIQGTESRKRTLENLEDFKVAFEASWMQVAWQMERRIADPKLPQTPCPEVEWLSVNSRRLPLQEAQRNGPTILPNQQRRVDAHKWMECMNDFSESFRQVMGHKDMKKPGHDILSNPITVALIDDGADITHPDLTGTNFEGSSFDHEQDQDDWHVNPYWYSAGGHGTLMARLIHRICPSARICVIKLKTMATNSSPKLQVDPRSAIKAIDYATELGANIISMSWTVKPPVNEDDKTAFIAAINNADAKRILMFCSAGDQGQYHEQDATYPYAINPNATFCIGAARATGETAGFVSKSTLDFVFPGYEVRLDNEGIAGADHLGKDSVEFDSYTGSSVATALASGLAALVQECVRLSVLYSIDTKDQNLIRRGNFDKIKTRSAMKEAFRYIGLHHETDDKYVEVWRVFKETTKKLEKEDELNGKLEVISHLAIHLVRY
ncbi:hypothetical protein N0V93_010344 [Gnomoniopsis smithogilvyi]|uniref:Peptidase S8/S53 domain-containing protein n=1 Tax=Gnomoniopsis smithogilvyi TaxID=1191159 RepID=A0A9W8YHS4_9PEZI|nr:hypothetical protein N0V93_010344 [Gnomoniopsis smithogilvyi]